MKSKNINLALDYSPFPAGRYIKDGPYTGEGFRKNLLVDAIRNNDVVVIELDGTLGYGSSFLEEAFGGLVREEGFSANELEKKLELKSSKQSIKNTIFDYIDKAQKELRKETK